MNEKWCTIVCSVIGGILVLIGFIGGCTARAQSHTYKKSIDQYGAGNNLLSSEVIIERKPLEGSTNDH